MLVAVQPDNNCRYVAGDCIQSVADASLGPYCTAAIAAILV
jgi:hypothetical protein